MRRDTAEQLRGARWSSTSRCARMGAYSALGAIPSPHSETVEGMFERGHDLEDAYARRLGERYSGPVIRELPIKWGNDWQLHLDFLLPDDDRRHLEVKSNTDVYTVPGARVEVGGVVTKASIVQVAGAAVFDPDGGTASVVVMSPTNYTEREYRVELDDDMRGLVHELEGMVTSAVETGEMPPRVCSIPSDGIGRFCPFVDTCFAEWEPVEQHVDADHPAAELAARLRAAEDLYKAAKVGIDQWKAERDDLRRQLRDYTRPGLEYVLGGVRVRRTVSARGRRTFKLADALATGAIRREDIDGPLSRLGNYVTESAPQERWTIGDPIEDVTDG